MTSTSTELTTAIARDAYVFAYPLVLSTVTMRQVTNVAEPRHPFGPMNRLAHARTLPGSEFRVVIRPNVDTLYSSAYMDLGPEPLVLTAPRADRYYVLPLYDLWTNVFAVPGSRTTGTDRERHFLLTAPGWQGEVPEGVEVISAPTRFISVIGRTQVNGQDDLPAVHAVQDGMRLTPLSVWNGEADTQTAPVVLDPTLDMATPPSDLVAAMPAGEFFRAFADALRENPVSSWDYPMMHRLQRIGLSPENDFDLASLSPQLQDAVAAGVAAARADLRAEYDRLNGDGRRGWVYTLEGGSYGVNYLLRAGIAAWGLGMNLPDDAVYPSVATSSDDAPLHGAHRYVLRFDADRLPPADAFWSVTVYDGAGFLVENPIARYALGDRSGMPVGEDGRIELLLQAEDPGGDDSRRWLPTGDGPFNLMLRLYSPQRDFLTGGWEPPLVERR